MQRVVFISLDWFSSYSVQLVMVSSPESSDCTSVLCKVPLLRRVQPPETFDPFLHIKTG